MSTTTTSGLVSRTSASSSTALPTLPTTVNPERSSRLAKPSRSRVSSSATTARSGAGAVPASAVLVSIVNAWSFRVACLRNHLAPRSAGLPSTVPVPDLHATTQHEIEVAVIEMQGIVVQLRTEQDAAIRTALTGRFEVLRTQMSMT